MTIITDHSAMKPVLEAPNPTGKHAQWWMRVYGRGIKSIAIIYRAGKENAAADALSRSPVFPASAQGIGQDEMQVSVVTSADPEPSTALQGPTLSSLLHSTPAEENVTVDYDVEQMKDPGLRELALYLQREELPIDSERARRLVARAPQFVINDGILNYLDQGRRDSLRVAVPTHLREKLMHESHRGVLSGHSAGPKLYKALPQRWWWAGLYNDVLLYCKSCLECVVVTGAGCQHRPPLKPIPTQRPFQKIGVDFMDLPSTEHGNRHVVILQDMFTKWPMVFAVPDQRTERIARLLCEEIIPMFGIPEALLFHPASYHT